jgi:iron complex transport system substrate-binding protein
LPASPETVAAFLAAETGNGTKPSTLARRIAQWAEVDAVRAGRVHLSPKLPFGWVDFPPSVNRLIGLWWLAKIFYPKHFDEDIRALTRDFYSRFYHVTPSDAEIDRVLEGRG